MNWLDLFLIVILAISIATSFARGFTRELIGFLASIAALYLGAWFYRIPAAALRPHVGSPEAANVCGFLAIFTATIVLGWILSMLVGAVMKSVGLSWLDRLLGAGFGLAKGVIICIAVIFVLVALAPGKDTQSPPQSVVESRIAPYVIDVARAAALAAPKELRDEFARRYRQVKRIWEESLKRSPKREI